MNKSLIKIIALITMFSMTLAFVVGTIAMKRSTDYLNTEIEEKILNTAENHANDFSASFNHMEGLTDSLASHVLTTFDVGAFRTNGVAYMEEYKAALSKHMETSMNMVDTAHSLYVTFNPDFTSNDDEVWYAVVDGKVQKVEADFEANKRDFDYPYAEDMVYFFAPQNKDDGVWTGPYYDKDIDEEVFSYSRAIYIDGVFVGVAGADINGDDTIKRISEMQMYPNGYSALLDENLNFVVNPSEDKGEEKVIRAAVKAEFEKNPDSMSAAVKYDYDGTAKLIGYARMDNGWTMVIVQTQEEAYNPIKRLKEIFIILAGILGMVLVAFLYGFSRPFLKKQSSLEAENKEKEILLIYQSRQAKIGEMVGNITHQWKQPLNTIKLIMANLLDSYRYDDLDEERLVKSVDKVDGIIDKMAETVTDFSEFLKPAKEKDVFDVRECIRASMSLMEESLTYHRIPVEVECSDECKAYGYYNEFIHVVFNVMNNARDAIIAAEPEDRKIRVEIRGGEGMTEVVITNKGENIPEENLPNLFEPYFTTKQSSGGTGLGLYISKKITEERMGGKLSMENIEGGVSCRIMIPAAEKC